MKVIGMAALHDRSVGFCLGQSEKKKEGKEIELTKNSDGCTDTFLGHLAPRKQTFGGVVHITTSSDISDSGTTSHWFSSHVTYIPCSMYEVLAQLKSL